MKICHIYRYILYIGIMGNVFKRIAHNFYSNLIFKHAINLPIQYLFTFHMGIKLLIDIYKTIHIT